MPVVQTTHGHVHEIRLNRPEARNALSQELRAALSNAFTSAVQNPQVRAIVLTGTGPAFCAGLDLTELREAPHKAQSEHLADSRALGALFGQIAFCPVPVIAAVNGHAVAGGAGFVAAADIAIMAADAKFGFTEVRIGFIPALVSALLLPQISKKMANDLFLTGRLITANEALKGSLVNEVVPAASVHSRAMEIAQTIALQAPAAVQNTKALLTELAAQDLASALDLAAVRNAAARTNPELAEGIAAFFEKRTPAWQDTLH